jgi:ABC-type transport system involved in cytochrome bd biosynthesis fused ATPase/permease subunit
VTLLLLSGFFMSRSDGKGFLLIYAALVQLAGIPLVLAVTTISEFRERRNSRLTRLIHVILTVPGLMLVGFLCWLFFF